MRYSIIYASIRPEIAEQLSLGLVFLRKDGTLSIKYSKKKLLVLKYLYPKSTYNLITKVVESLKDTITDCKSFDYLIRYSNSFITFSNVETMDIEHTEENENWLYRQYVYK